MRNLFIIIFTVFVSYIANAEKFEGVFNSKILGQQTLKVSISTAAAPTTKAEAYISTEHDSILLYCNTSLNFQNIGQMELSLNQFTQTEDISVMIGSRQDVVENENQCFALNYTNQDLQDSQWVYKGTSSSLILSVKKNGSKTIIRRLILQFSMPMLSLLGNLNKIDQSANYELQHPILKLNNDSHIVYQITDETRGEYSSVSTLEQGRI